MAAKHLIIPVEIQHRELLAKLHLGVAAVARGYTVVLGNQYELAKRVFGCAPGVYLDKSAANAKAPLFAALARCGYAPAALCEEGLVYRDTERYLRERVSPETLATLRVFYCWGDRQRADVAPGMPAGVRVAVTGNPRFDLLRPAFRSLWRAEAEAHRATHGDYLLVNTNFSRFNRLPGALDVVSLMKKRGRLDTRAGEEYYNALVRRLETVMTGLLAVVEAQARRAPERVIVLRPHPGEADGPYLELAARHRNIVVTRAGHVAPWLLGAAAVLHNSCTTGVEGWLLERPVISYSPGGEAPCDSHLPTALSHAGADQEETLRLLEQALDGALGPRRDSAALATARRYLHALEGPLAAEAILDHLPSTLPAGSGGARFVERLRQAARRWARRLPGLGLPPAQAQLARQKFPGTSLAEIEAMVAALVACRPERGDGLALRVVRLRGCAHVYRLTAG